MAVDDVLQYIATNEIKWIDLQFFGVDGSMNSVTVSRNEIEESSFTKGIPVGDLTEVYGKSEQGELVLLPDPETIARIPWKESVARLICDVIAVPSGEKFLKNPRYMLERMETNLSALGIKTAAVKSTVEFYIIENEGRVNMDRLDLARNQIVNTLEDSFGVEVVSHQHGKNRAAQQYMELREHGLKGAADAIGTMKYVVKNLSTVANAVSSFMPYPVAGESGNTLEIHQSMWKTGENNIFYDANDEYSQISQTARYYIGGLLEHAPSLCAFTNPTTNSYRRLFVEQKYIGWSKVDRNASVVVPFKKKNDKEGKMIAYTLSDPAVNPYLAYAAVVAAGIDGIKNKIDCGDPSDVEGKKKTKAKELPGTLKDAIHALETDSKFLKGIFSAEIIGDYLNLKLADHRESLKAISNWELERYVDV